MEYGIGVVGRSMGSAVCFIGFVGDEFRDKPAREAQRQIINEEMLKLDKQNPTDSDYYLVVSYNPLEPEAKIEMGVFLKNEESK